MFPEDDLEIKTSLIIPMELESSARQRITNNIILFHDNLFSSTSITDDIKTIR